MAMRTDLRGRAEVAWLILLSGGFFAAALGVQQLTHAWQSDLGTGGDEAGHFVSALLVYDYLRSGLPGSPMKFALRYYHHWPRVAIGHWPPLFYILQGLAFVVTGRSVGAAIGFQALITGVAAGWTAWLVRRRLDPLVGVSAGISVLLAPQILFSISLVMVDTMLAVWMLAAALAWAAFARRPGTARALLFAASAIGAILTKGNGIALAALPLFHAILMRSTSALRDRRAWLAAALVGLMTAPWYVVTYRIAAGGFVYHWGESYTERAVPYYLSSLFTILGPLGVAGVVGVLVVKKHGSDDSTLAACGALVLSLLAFQWLAPAALTTRYLIALVPAGMVLAACGLDSIVRSFVPRTRADVLVASFLLTNAAFGFRMPHLSPYGMNLVTKRIMQVHEANRFVLVAGNDHAEGALIAAFAAADPARKFYILRASQLLATTNFMGSIYHVRFPRSAQVATWLRHSGIGWVVIALPYGGPAMRHDEELLRVLINPATHAALIFSHSEARGIVNVYQLPARSTSAAQAHALLRRTTPIALSHSP